MRADFGAGMTRRFAESTGKRPKATTRKCGGADRMRVCGGAQKKNSGTACRPRPQRSAEDSARGDDGANQFGLEELGGEIRGGHGAPAQKIEDAILAQAANAAPGLEKIPQIFRGRRLNVGRRDGCDVRADRGNFRERLGELSVVPRVFGGKAGDAAGGLCVIVVEKDALSRRAWVQIGAGPGRRDDSRTFAASSRGRHRREAVRQCARAWRRGSRDETLR